MYTHFSMIEPDEIHRTDRQKEVDRGTPLCAYSWHRLLQCYSPFYSPAIRPPDARMVAGRCSPVRELLDKAQTLLYSMEAEVTRGGAVVSSLGS